MIQYKQQKRRFLKCVDVITGITVMDGTIVDVGAEQIPQALAVDAATTDAAAAAIAAITTI